MQTALGPPYSQCNKSENYRQVTCVDDCFFGTMSEICGCAYPSECGDSSGWTKECRDTYNSSAIQSNCNLQCPAECNLVSFPLNRIDAYWDISQSGLDYYKSIISGKFNTTGMSDDQIKKGMTWLYIYFSKFETTEITQSPSMTPTNLVANVGGLLGK